MGKLQRDPRDALGTVPFRALGQFNFELAEFSQFKFELAEFSQFNFELAEFSQFKFAGLC